MKLRRRTIRARRPKRNPPKFLRLSRRTRRRASRKAPRHNPPKSGQKGYKTPASVRRKISLAVKRAQAARGRGGVTSRVKSLFRRRSSRRRIGGSRGRSILGRIRGGSEIKRLFSTPTVKLAVGAVGAGFVTSIVVNKFGQHLPGIATPVGRVGYRLGIPLLAAALTRKFDQSLANGMIIGAAVSGVNEIIRIISGSPATVPVIANRAMPNQAGLVGAGGRGATLSGYVGYEGSDEDFEAYSDDGDFEGFAEEAGGEWD